MGGGVGWKNVFRDGTKLDTGTYILVAGNRLSDGSVPVRVQLFTIEEGQTTTLDLVLREAADAVSVIGSFPSSLVPDVGRGFYVTGVLEVGKEPTNHALRDIAKVSEAFEKWGRPVVLFCTDQAQLERLQKENAEGRYGTLPATVRFAVDAEGQVLQTLKGNLNLPSGNLPIFIIGDTFDKVAIPSVSASRSRGF